MSEAILAVLTAALAGIFKALFDYQRVRLAPTRLGALVDLARTVVASAEKIGEATGIKGPDKYAVAEQALTSLARRVGVKLRPEEANSLIHAALREFQQVLDYEALAELAGEGDGDEGVAAA